MSRQGSLASVPSSSFGLHRRVERTIHKRSWIASVTRGSDEAMAMAEQHRPVVVLLDVQLPDVSGLEVCRAIKQKWPQVMVLQTSASFTTGTFQGTTAQKFALTVKASQTKVTTFTTKVNLKCTDGSKIDKMRFFFNPSGTSPRTIR